MKTIILNKEFKETLHKCYILKTNSLNFKIFYQINHTPKGNYPHIGIGAREGLCILYRRSKDDYWRNLDIYVRSNEISVNLSKYVPKNKFYELLIYCPILTQLDIISISIPNEDTINEISFNKNMLIAGGIHSYGVGCTTTGLMFSNILSRMLEYNVKNISVYENNFIKNILKSLEDIEEKYDLGILELDFVNQEEEYVTKYLKNVISAMEKKCDKLICWWTIPNSKKSKIQKLSNIIESISNSKIEFIDMSCLYDDEYKQYCTSSDNFLNDTGNIFIFKKFSKVLGD